MRLCMKIGKKIVLLATLVLSVLFFSGRTVWADSDPVSVPIDEEHFENDEFRQYVSESFDLDSDGYLNAEEGSAVEEINTLRDEAWCGLRELQYFPNIKTLNTYLLVTGDDSDLNLNGFSGLKSLEKAYIHLNYSGAVGEFSINGLPKLVDLQIEWVYPMDYESYLRKETYIDLVSIRNCPKLVKVNLGEGSDLNLTLENCESLENINSGYLYIKKLELSGLMSLKYVLPEPTYGPWLIDIGENVAVSKYDLKPKDVEYGEGMSRYVAALRYTIVLDSGDKTPGWYKSYEGKKSYIDADRRAATGIRKIGNELYFFGQTHFLTEDTGWKEYNGNWYYIEKGGVVRTWWVKSNGNWYYLGNDGSMKTGWQRVDGKWYYLRDNGIMLRSQYIQGYWLNKDGSCTYKPVAKWRKDAVGTYYQDTAGYYVRNTTVIIDRRKYTFDRRGYLVQ